MIKCCSWCGVEFKALRPKGKFCSRRCSGVAWRNDPSITVHGQRKVRVRKNRLILLFNRKARGPKLGPCETCARPLCKDGARFCRACRRSWCRVTVRCRQCSTEFSAKSWENRVYCSQKCYKISCIGVGNPRYIDGRTPKNKIVRNSRAYKEWRAAVFARDNYTCVHCGQWGGPLNADHIKPFSKYPELRMSLDNGRTLCVPCHILTPTYKRKASSYKEEDQIISSWLSEMG